MQFQLRWDDMCAFRTQKGRRSIPLSQWAHSRYEFLEDQVRIREVGEMAFLAKRRP